MYSFFYITFFCIGLYSNDRGYLIFFFLDAPFMLEWVVVLLNLFIWFTKVRPFFFFFVALKHFIKTYRL